MTSPSDLELADVIAVHVHALIRLVEIVDELDQESGWDEYVALRREAAAGFLAASHIAGAVEQVCALDDRITDDMFDVVDRLHARLGEVVFSSLPLVEDEDLRELLSDLSVNRMRLQLDELPTAGDDR